MEHQKIIKRIPIRASQYLKHQTTFEEIKLHVPSLLIRWDGVNDRFPNNQSRDISLQKWLTYFANQDLFEQVYNRATKEALLDSENPNPDPYTIFRFYFFFFSNCHLEPLYYEDEMEFAMFEFVKYVLMYQEGIFH